MSSAKQLSTATLAMLLAAGTLTTSAMPALADEHTPTPDTTQTQAAGDYTVTIPLSEGDHTATLTANTDGDYQLNVNGTLAADTNTLTVTNTDGDTVLTLDSKTTEPAKTLILGQTQGDTTVFTGTASIDGTDRTFTVRITPQPTGDPITVDGQQLTSTNGADPTYSNTKPVTVALNKDNTPAITEATLSNGQTLPITWQTPSLNVTDNGFAYQATGEASGNVDGHNVTIHYIASRTMGAWTVTSLDGNPGMSQQGATMTYTGDWNQFTVPDQMQVTADDMTVTVPQTANTVHDASGDVFGVNAVQGEATYHLDADSTHPAFTITLNVNATTGSAVTLNDGGAFTKSGDTYVAQSSNYTLNDQNKPNSDVVTLSNGDTAPITWGDKVQTITKTVDGAEVKFLRLDGVATGQLKVGDATQSYKVEVTADRAVNTAMTKLTVTQTNAKGDVTSIDVPDFTPDQHEYTITLPHSAVGDSYMVNVTAGVDATIGKPSVTLDGTSRILTVNVNGIDYKVTVAFQPADIVADSPAKLEGIYVNYHGDTKGDLIEGWNPNRLDYTIALQDANQSPYLLPVAPEGVSVKAGNVVQSAQSTRQEWVVTDDASGASRVYSVTVTRPVHTAVTDFTPNAPIAQDATVQPDSPADTTLASVGYVDKDGKYVPQQGDKFIIPDGGTFSYEPKVGQSATVTVTRNGMTFTYVVNVLGADGSSFAQHTYVVTYVTPATSKAVLDGIVVDGAPVGGFSPDKTEYTVKVNDPDMWTVVAQYDKASGMSVTIEKHGADATLTAISGDGLNTRVYRVHAERKLFAGAGTAGVKELANTGMGVGWVVGLAAVLIAAGAAVWAMLAGAKGRRSDGSGESEPGDMSDAVQDDVSDDGSGEASDGGAEDASDSTQDQ